MGAILTQTFTRRRVTLGPEFEDRVCLSEESMVVRVLDSWTCCISSEETERSKHICSAPSHLIYHRTLARELVLSTLRLSFSTSVNPICTLSHRFSIKFVSWVILDPFRLTTSINHHKVEIEATPVSLYKFFDPNMIPVTHPTLTLEFPTVISLLKQCITAVKGYHRLLDISEHLHIPGKSQKGVNNR